MARLFRTILQSLVSFLGMADVRVETSIVAIAAFTLLLGRRLVELSHPLSHPQLTGVRSFPRNASPDKAERRSASAAAHFRVVSH